MNQEWLLYPCVSYLVSIKCLQKIRGELTVNVVRLSEVDNKITYEQTKLKDMEDGAQYTDEMREKVRKRIEDLKIDRDARLELISLNRKDMQSQISRIKQTIEKVLDSDTSLADKIRTIFREQGITIASILTAFGLLISTIVGFLTGSGGSASVPQHT